MKTLSFLLLAFVVAPAPLASRADSPAAPQFTDWPAVRSVSGLGVWLSDIESRMPAGHIYRDADAVTWAHETTHGINSRIRQAHASRGRVNGVYVLQGQAVVFQEPPIRLSDVAATVPAALRGETFQLYLVQQRQYWENEPLYVLDEWAAYTNGSLVGMERGVARGESLQFALEFTAYAFSLCATVERYNQQHGRSYDDRQLKAFTAWHAGRVLWMYDQVRQGRYPAMRRAGQDQYFARMQAEDGLNRFCAWYLGWAVRGWKPTSTMTQEDRPCRAGGKLLERLRERGEARGARWRRCLLHPPRRGSR